MKPEIKTRPILMNGAMVRAVLDGSKTQTRRIMKPQPGPIPGEPGKHWWPSNAVQSMMRVEDSFQRHPGIFDDACPHGQPGNRIWVRETFCLDDDGHQEWPVFRADGAKLPQRQPTRKPARWTPSIHMPRWASRITLEITGVRVERLRDISTEDIIAEGLSTTLRGYDAECDLRDQWRKLWESTGGDWDSNPWLWVISFKRVMP